MGRRANFSGTQPPRTPECFGEAAGGALRAAGSQSLPNEGVRKRCEGLKRGTLGPLRQPLHSGLWCEGPAALAGSGVHERLLKPLGNSLQEVVNDPPSLFLQGVEKQPIVAGPWWLLANQHQGTAIEAGLWVKPPMRLGRRQCGRGFPSLERSRPSSRGLAAPVHQCLSGSRPSTFS